MSSATGTAQFGLNAEQQAIRKLAISFGKEEICELTMLNGEMIRLDGALRMAAK